jgi:hypothetical protein
MTKYLFDTFNEARDFARFLSTDFEIVVKIIPLGAKFLTWHEEEITIEKYQYFSQHRIWWTLDKEEKLRLLGTLDTSVFQEKSLVWPDNASGLVWDISRRLSGSNNTDFPNDASMIMNAVFYGGRKGWRLPTIEELKTLDISKLEISNIKNYISGNGKMHFWASDRSTYDSELNSFFDVLNRQRRSQRYKEQHPDKHSYGDGYIESAQTILVSVEAAS